MIIALSLVALVAAVAALAVVIIGNHRIRGDE
jgi:hypothetical protein